MTHLYVNIKKINAEEKKKGLLVLALGHDGENPPARLPVQQGPGRPQLVQALLLHHHAVLQQHQG